MFGSGRIIPGGKKQFRIGINGPTLMLVGILAIAAALMLFLTVSGVAAIGPQGSYTELNGADKVEFCTSLGGAPNYSCNNPTTSFAIGSTVYVRIQSSRVADLSVTNSLQLINYAGTTVRSSTFTQRIATAPYVYTGSILTSGTNYLKVIGTVQSATARFTFEQHLESLANQYMRFYKASGQTNESYTFRPGATVYITAYGSGQNANSTNNYAMLTKFDNTSFSSTNPGTVNPVAGNLYNFTYTMPALGGNAVDGDWYWLATRLRRSTGAVVEQMSRMIQIDGSNPTASITSPLAGTYILGSVPITGTATDLYSFDNWVLEYGVGPSPSSWTQIGAGTTPVSGGNFTSWDTTTVTDNQYTLRLTVTDRAGNTAQGSRLVNVDNNSPLISDISVSPVTSATATVNWTTSELADSYIEYDTDSGVPYTDSLSDSLMVTSHSLNLVGLAPNTTYYYRLRSTDAAGHITWTTEATFRTASIMVLQPFPSVGKDASFESGQPTYNHGAEAYLRVADGPALGTTRSTLKFDLTGIPAGSTIVSATMSLYQMGQGDSSAPTLNVHALNHDWAEGAGTGSATGDGATWMKYDNANNWTAAGGDFNPALSASALASPVTGAWVNWNLTTLTQSWVNSPASNYGNIIKQDVENPAGNDIKTFYSSDYSNDASLRPKLVIEWLGSDVTAPHIDEVRAEGISQSSATIRWSTDENANSRVEYGTTTPSYGSLTTLDPTLANQHTVSLSMLTPDTVYHFRVRSIDPSGQEAISGDYVFQTARVIVIQPDGLGGADTWINAGQTSNNYGAATDLVSGDNGGTGVQRSLLKFDLSQISAGSTIISATLSLYQHAQADPTTPEFGTYAVTGSWKEGTGLGTATGDGATWATSNGVNAWTTAGGDFGPVQCAAAAPDSGSGAWFDLTCMKDLVQSWVAGTTTNYGLIIKKTTEAPVITDYKTFFSSDYTTDASLRPKLTVEYVPVPGSLAMSVDETWNRDGSYGGGSVGFGNVSAGGTYYVGNGASPPYAVKLTVLSNTTWGLKLSAFDNLKQTNPANFIAISNLAWDDSDNPAGWQEMVISPADTMIASSMPPTGGASYRFDYRLTLPSLAVSGNYTVPAIYTAYPS